MNATAVPNIIRVYRHEKVLTFHVEGRANMQQSLPLRRLAERALDEGTPALHFDLRQCTYMDSTFLGTLLLLKKHVEAHGGDFALVCPSACCCRLLQQMGLADVYPVRTDEEPLTGEPAELIGTADDIEMFKLNVVQAHQELAGISGPAGETFTPVARSLTEALEAERRR